MQGKSGAGHSERMPDGDGTSIDIDAVRIDVEFPGAGNSDGGEGLVDLDEIKRYWVYVCPLAGPLDGLRWLQLQRGIRARDRRVRPDFSDPTQSESFGVGTTGDHDRCRAVGQWG